MTINAITISGNVGAPPERKDFEGGGSICTFRLATTERWQDRSGRAQERTDWHTVVVRGALVDEVMARVTKGSRVLVVGASRERTYVATGNVSRTVHELHAREVGLLLVPARRERGEAPRAQQTAPPAAAPEGGQELAPADGSGSDDDIPF